MPWEARSLVHRYWGLIEYKDLLLSDIHQVLLNVLDISRNEQPSGSKIRWVAKIQCRSNKTDCVHFRVDLYITGLLSGIPNNLEAFSSFWHECCERLACLLPILFRVQNLVLYAPEPEGHIFTFCQSRQQAPSLQHILAHFSRLQTRSFLGTGQIQLILALQIIRAWSLAMFGWTSMRAATAVYWAG